MKNTEKIKEHVQAIMELIEEDKKTSDDFEIDNRYYIDEKFNIKNFIEDPDAEVNRFKESDDFNMFTTPEEASAMARKTNAMYKLYHIAKHLNNGWKPDFDDIDTCKYYIDEEYEVAAEYSSDRNCQYFNTNALAEKAIKLMGEQSLKDYFQVM